MKILPIQEAYKRKFERQKAIKELEYHASGHCVHIGMISPGCYGCFAADPFRHNIILGAKCNLNCAYCYTSSEKEKSGKKRHLNLKAAILQESLRPDYSPKTISFSGGGEPLLYVGMVSSYMKLFRQIEKGTRKRPWYFLYTNGILADRGMLLRLRDLGFDEIRFHLGASNFSRKVYRNMRIAAGYFKAVSVETPAWPLHRRKLFEMLPAVNDIGVKHLNIGEIEVTARNFSRIAKALPGAQIYQCYEMHLYDGGLVYDMIEEVLKRRYSYSVLDCNCFVKSIQRGPAKWVSREDTGGLCAVYK